MPPKPDVEFVEKGGDACISRDEANDLARYLLRLRETAKDHGAVEAK